LLTPVMWDASRMPVHSLAGKIVRINPAFHFVEFVRAPALGSAPELFTLIYMAVLTIVGLLAAGWFYRRYRQFVPLWI
ncbi:ABC transporter permease, partial [Rhizobiaceae sp. 2RAB30]